MKNEISKQDVLDVAKSLNKTLTDIQIDQIINNYSPSNGDLWFEEVENLIYQTQ